MKHPSLPFLYWTAVCQAVGWYVIGVTVFLSHAHRTVDASDFLPTFRPHVIAEYDTLLYAAGFLILPLLASGWFIFLRKCDSIAHFLFSWSLLFLGVLLGCIAYAPDTFREAATLLVALVNSVIIGGAIFFSQRLHTVLRTTASIIDRILLGSLLFLTGWLFFVLFFSATFLSPPVVAWFQRHSYTYFTGFSPGVAAITTLVLGGSIALRIRWGRYHLKGYQPYILDGLAILTVISFVSLGIPSTDSARVDYMSIIGPIRDVLGGKTLLVNVHSQYGLLMIYALSAVFRFVDISYHSFFFLNYSTTILGYIALYALLVWWMNSRFYGWLGLSLIALQHYFAQTEPLLFYGQATFLRFGMWIPTFAVLLLRAFLARRVRFLEYVILGIIGISVFWAFDTGIYVVGGYCFALLVEAIHGSIGLRAIGGKLLRSLTRLTATLVFFFLCLSFYTYVRAGISPNWRYFVEFTLHFAGGWGMLPMPHVGLWYLLIGGYLLTGAWVLYKAQKTLLTPLAFLAGYGSLQFLYYTGRSAPTNMRIVILPFLLLLCWFFFRLEQWVQHPEKHPKQQLYRYTIGLLLLLFFLLFTIGTTAGILNMWGTILHRNQPTTTIQAVIVPPMTQHVAPLQSLEPFASVLSHPIALISAYDGEVLLELNRVNIIDSNPLVIFDTYSQLRPLGEQLLEKNPPVVIVDHDVRSDRVAVLLEYVKQRYHLSHTLGFFDVWERK